jgi:hypothetical protein
MQDEITFFNPTVPRAASTESVAPVRRAADGRRKAL